MARPAYRWVSSVAAVSGLMAQFYVNQAERKCSQAKKQRSDKIQKQERSGISVYVWTGVCCHQEYKYIPAGVKWLEG